MRLVPTKDLTTVASQVMALDTSTFAEVAKPKIAVIIADFTEDVNLTAADLTFGSADGLEPKTVATVPPATYFDPTDGARVILNRDPAGGWLWTYTGSTPVTVYGVAMTDNAGTTLWGYKKLTPNTSPAGPVNLVGVGEAFLLGAAEMAIPLGTF